MIDRYNKYFTEPTYNFLISYAICFDNEEIWSLCHARGAIPTEYYINHIAEEGCLKALVYLAERGILPDISFIINDVAGKGPLDVLLWFEQRGYLPDEVGANDALSNSHTHVVQWLENKGIFSNAYFYPKGKDEKFVFKD